MKSIQIPRCSSSKQRGSNKHIKALALCAFMLLFFMLPSLLISQNCPPQGSTNQLLNGSFDSPVCQINGNVNGAINIGCAPNWMAAHGTPSLCSSTFALSPFDGTPFACLGSSSSNDFSEDCHENEAMFQNLNICPGVKYRLVFHWGNILGRPGYIHIGLTNGLVNVPNTALGAPCFEGTALATFNAPDVNGWQTETVDITGDAINNQLVIWITPGLQSSTGSDFGFDGFSLTCIETPLSPEFAVQEACLGQFNFAGSVNSDPVVGVASWCWDFGDGTAGSGQNVSHTYASPGTYQVCLTISDNCGGCTAKICHNVVYNRGLSIVKTFTEDPATGLLTFTINVGNGDPTQANNILVTDALPNTLSVVNANGFTVTGNTLTRLVNIPANTQTPLTFTARRNNNCTCTAIENCASAVIPGGNCPAVTSCITVPAVSATPDASITSLVVDPVDCYKVNVIAAVDNQCYTHAWDFGDGTTGTGASTNHVYTVNGTFTVTHTVTNDCGTATATTTVTIDCNVQEFTCPCTGIGSLNINAGEVSVDPTQPAVGLSVLATALSGGQSSQNTYSNTGRCIAIRGNLVIDQNFTLGIDGGEIRMQPGARITVKKGATLNLKNINDGNSSDPTKKGIHGCSQMWRSLIVEPGASISLSNNTIQDAEFAVDVKGTTADVPSLNSTGNDFNRNHTGIRINGPVLTPAPTAFSQNTFHATNLLLPVYSSGINNWNPKYPYVGIDIANSGTLTIGDKNDPASKNSFLGIRNGILESGGKLEVYYGVFKKLYGSMLPLESPSGNLQGLGIFARSCLKLTVQHCTFGGDGSNGWRGISVARCNLEAKYNDMYDIQSGIYVFPAGAQTFTIEENSFKANSPALGFLNAIVINGSTSSQQGIIKINNNNPIELRNGGTGILLTNDPNNTGNAANRRVSNNYIYNVKAGAGVSVKNSNNWAIDNNHIFFSGFPNTNISYETGAFGIQLDNADRCFVKENEIRATDGSILGATMRGIEVKGAERCTLCCNLTDHSRFGNYFMGSCNPTYMRHERQYSHEIGLYCENIGTVTGDQNWAGNEWLGSYDFLGAYHTGSQSNIESSEFRVESPITTSFWPISRYPDGDDWFRELPGSSLTCGASDALCPNLPSANAPENPRDLTETEIKVAADAYTGPHPYDRITQREAERSLYSEMVKNVSLSGQDGNADQFFNNARSGVLGQLFEVDRQIALLGNTSPAQTNRQQQINFMLDSLSQRLLQLDQAYALAHNATDSAAIQAQKRNCILAAQPLAAEWTSIDESGISEVALAVPALQALINAIPSSSDQWVENQKIVRRIYLETVAIGNFSITPQQMTDLSSVAGQCMLQGGDAVLQARSLYNVFAAEPWAIDDSELCDSPSQQRNKSTESVSVPEKAKIIPNPTADAFSVYLPKVQAGEPLRLQLFDAQGVLVKEIQTLNGASVSAHLAPGPYICRIYLNNLPYESLKLVIAP